MPVCRCRLLKEVRVVVQTNRMARPKKNPDAPNPPTERYRKPFTPARIKGVLADAAKRRAEELAQDFAQYVNDAVRMRLEAEGYWPPKPRP